MATDDSFTVPVEEMGLDPDRTLEVGLAGGNPLHLQIGASRALIPVDGLVIRPCGRRAIDFEQALFVAGNVAQLVQAIGCLWQWYSHWRQTGEGVGDQRGADIHVTLRTKAGGELRLHAASEADVRRLQQQLERTMGPQKRTRKRKGPGGNPPAPSA